MMNGDDKNQLELNTLDELGLAGNVKVVAAALQACLNHLLAEKPIRAAREKKNIKKGQVN